MTPEQRAFLSELQFQPLWGQILQELESIKKSVKYKNSNDPEDKKINGMIYASGWNECASQVISLLSLQEVNHADRD